MQITIDNLPSAPQPLSPTAAPCCTSPLEEYGTVRRQFLTGAPPMSMTLLCG